MSDSLLRRCVTGLLLGVGLASLACGGAADDPPVAVLGAGAPAVDGSAGPGEPAAGASPKPDTAPQTVPSSRADAGSAPRKRVFVTAATFEGNLQLAGNAPDGIAGADKLCKAAATGAHLGGTWKAFVSGVVGGVTVHAASRIADMSPWHLLDGTVAVASVDELSATLSHAIDLDELGVRVTRTAEAAVWTGTRLGSFTQGCTDVHAGSWALGRAPWLPVDPTATMGDCRKANEWSAAVSDYSLRGVDAVAPCYNRARLYCFEQ
ncbi:MAG: hypothetical protein IPG50_35075 [Myxococcales bacterium]|nr:hypothetical protein [Myxococcales bacterium]